MENGVSMIGRANQRGDSAVRRYGRRTLMGAALTGGAVGFGVALAGCERRGSRTGSTPALNGNAGAPRSGGRLRLADKDEPENFDVSRKLSYYQVLSITNDSLITYQAGPGVDYNSRTVAPNLAEKWESPDAQTYVFTLANDTRFANLPPVNGRALTSADIKWSYEYLSRSGQFRGQTPLIFSNYFQGISSIEAPDAGTVVVKFGQPFAPFLNYAASESTPILAHEIFDQDGDFSKRAVGSGPWQMDPTASQRGQQWTYAKNPSYFRKGLPYIDQIVDLVVPEDATANAAFQSKQLDVLDYTGLTPQTIEQMKRSIPDAVSVEYLDPAGGLIYINVSKPILADVRIRRAIGLSMDRDQYIKALVGGKGEWALTGSEPGLFTADETRQLLKPDPAQAKRLVEDAGYPNGVEIEFIYPGKKFGERYITMLQLLQAQVKPSGINLALKSIDEATDIKRKKAGDYFLGVTSKSPGVDLDSYLYGVFHPGSADDNGQVNDPQLTKLLDAQRQEPDPTKRKDLWRQAVRRINEQAWGHAFFYGTSYALWQPYLKDYAPNVAFNREPARKAWLTQG